MYRVLGTDQIQAELERGMQEEGRQRYLTAMGSAVERGVEVGTPYGQRLLSLHTTRYAQALEAWIEASTGRRGRRHSALEYLAKIDARSACWIALQTILNSISKPRVRLSTLGLQVGRSILVEIEMRELQRKDKALHAGILKTADTKTQQYRKEVCARFLQEKAGYEVTSASTQACMLLGVRLVELATECLGIITCEMDHSVRQTAGRKRHERNLLVRPTPEVVEWIRAGHAIFQELDPIYQPMVVPPVPWTHPLVGGYLTNDIKPLTLVKTNSKRYFNKLANCAMPEVYEAVNRVQATPWRINLPIMQVIEGLLQTNSELGGMPRAELLPIPEKPADIDTNEASRRAYRREAAQTHHRNVALTCRRVKVAGIMRIAKKYMQYGAIYFPHQLDFRGRVYPVTQLSPQGEDFVKALLEFAEGEPLGTQVAADWLAIHIANLFGVDKVDFATRIKWTQDHSDMLLAIANNPHDNREWCDADSPFQALAAAFEWKGYLKHGLDHVSRIPIALDGSCSGLQNFGMALRCEDTGRAVNLVPSDKPQDIYQTVIDKVGERLIQLAGDNWQEMSLEAAKHRAREAIRAIYPQSTRNLPIDVWMDQTVNVQYDEDGMAIQRRGVEAEAFNRYWDIVCAYQWLKFGYDTTTQRMSRKFAKRAVMTFPYSSKEFGFRDQLLEDFDLRNEPAFGDNGWRAAGVMARLLWEAVNNTVVLPAMVMEWLQVVARAVSKAGRRVSWLTPLGFLVEQGYVKTTETLVQTSFAGRENVRLTLPSELTAPCTRKNAAAMSPNFVHALDASHLMLTVARSPDIKNWAVIHDSFGTLASRTQSLFLYVRVAFMELYTTHDVLEEFRDQMLMDPDTHTRIDLPATPPRGGLNLHAVLQSRYCFA